MVDYYASVFGAYPFESVGAIVDDAPDVGYSLESQTKPNFAYSPDEATVAHELSHQWFGDARDAALVERHLAARGLRDVAEWLWREHHGGTTGAQKFKELYSRARATPTSGPAPGRPRGRRRNCSTARSTTVAA